MRYCDVSFDELEELEQEIHAQEEQEGVLNYSKIELYDAMHSHLAKWAEEDKDYWTYYTYIQEKLIDHLLCYGGHLSSIDTSLRYTAEKSMEQILAYDPQNALACYRLACLLHKQGDHEKAVRLLQSALASQQNDNKTMYRLNEDQMNRSFLLMINSSLKLASRAFVVSPGKATVEGITGFKNLSTEIRSIDKKLQNTAYRFISNDSETLCSKDHIDQAAANLPKDTIGLYFSEEGPKLIYNGIREQLAVSHAHLLYHLLSNSCKNDPMKPLDMTKFFLDTHVITGVTKHTFNRSVSALLQVLNEVEIPSIIYQIHNQGQPAYYFNGSLKYAVFLAVDDELNFG